ncbi:PD40 domain-containing protein [Hymenobacter coalescens]
MPSCQFLRLPLLQSLIGLTALACAGCLRPAGAPSARPLASPDFGTLTTGPAELLGPGSLSTAANEYNPSLTPDGRTLVFARSQPDFKDAHIFITRLERGHWQVAQPLPFTDARYADSDPSFTPDGRTLYFASDRPAPSRDSTRRDLDLWQVSWDGRHWGKPEHLGPAINGKGMELGPSLSEGFLYFSSARRSGQGGLDGYRARQQPGGFAAPDNVGPTLNTAASESDLEMTADGRWVLFWSDRPGGAGGGDLYAAPRTAAGWGPAVRLPGEVNSPAFDFTPTLSADGQWLYFASTRRVAGSGTPAVLNGQANLYRARLMPRP